MTQLPLYHNHLTSPILARIQQTFFGDQHKNKKYFPFLSLRAKKGFEIQLQRYLQDQFLPGRYIMIQFRGPERDPSLDNKKMNS